jgi:hypothetical protein
VCAIQTVGKMARDPVIPGVIAELDSVHAGEPGDVIHPDQIVI